MTPVTEKELKKLFKKIDKAYSKPEFLLTSGTNGFNTCAWHRRIDTESGNVTYQMVFSSEASWMKSEVAKRSELAGIIVGEFSV